MLRTALAASILGAALCLSAAPHAAPQQPDLIHDAMGRGEHPEYLWHANLVGWFVSLDGFMTGLPDLGWRSAVISDVRFDVRSDTTMLIARIDRNVDSRFVIGFTPAPAWGNWYDYDFITLGVMIGDDGDARPVWAIGDTLYEPAFLEPGIYDLRLTLDRSAGTLRAEADTVGAYDAPLSRFDEPVWSAVWSREIEEVLYIQICPYNEFSAVYDVWSTIPNPGLLQIESMQDITVVKGDTVAIPAAAAYDGDDPLVWSISDPRFSLVDTAFVMPTGPGGCGLHHTLLSVTDGYLCDTVTVRYAVTHLYHDPVLHHRMYGGGGPFGWHSFGKTLWYNTSDGFLASDDTTKWTSAVVAELREDLDASCSWVFRVAAGGGNEYALGLTCVPPDEHTGYINSIGLGATLYGDGTIFPSFGTGCTDDDGAVLDSGIHDILITWDPAAGQARFEAAPVASWIDSLSDFPGASVWTACAEAPLAPPAWVQINLKGFTPRVYDVWRIPVSEGPSGLLSGYSAEGQAAGIRIEWSFLEPPEGDECVVVRCTGLPGDCETILRIPLAMGAVSYHCLDEEARPGSTFTYRVYLDDGGLELLFDSGPVTVPCAAAVLFQNHPNPFNPSTTIEWYLPGKARASVRIYDVSGRIVRRLFEGRCPAGTSAVTWDGLDDDGAQVSAGVYFCRIAAGEFEQARKMVLVR